MQFKRRVPASVKAYAAACGEGEVQPGRMFIFETSTMMLPHYVINLPTNAIGAVRVVLKTCEPVCKRWSTKFVHRLMRLLQIHRCILA